MPKASELELPTVRGKLTKKVGDFFTVAAQEWFPDNDGAEPIGGVLVLAAATSEGLTYQAVAPGTTVMTVGPVGHPGGCDQPGKSCVDATPPPTAELTVTQ